MAVSNVPAYVQKFRPATALVTTAIGAIGTSAPTGVVALVTGGANGSIIKRISAMPRSNATASSLMLFHATAAAPTVLLPMDSETMLAYTFGVTAEVPKTVFPDINNEDEFYLASGDVLWVGAQVVPTSGIAFVGQVGDL